MKMFPELWFPWGLTRTSNFYLKILHERLLFMFLPKQSSYSVIICQVQALRRIYLLSNLLNLLFVATWFVNFTAMHYAETSHVHLFRSLIPLFCTSGDIIHTFGQKHMWHICTLRFTSGVTPLPVYVTGIATSHFPHVHAFAEVGCRTRLTPPKDHWLLSCAVKSVDYVPIEVNGQMFPHFQPHFSEYPQIS